MTPRQAPGVRTWSLPDEPDSTNPYARRDLPRPRVERDPHLDGSRHHPDDCPGPTDGLAITALVLSVSGFHLLVPFFAIPALRRIRRRRRSAGRGMARASLWLSGTSVVLQVAMVVSAPWVVPAMVATVDPPAATGVQPATYLRDGDCFSATPDPIQVDVVPCDVPHDAEVYATVDLAGSRFAYPGATSVASDSERVCREEFAAFVGVPATGSALSFGVHPPNWMTWVFDDRTITCFVVDPVAQTTGTLEGSGR